MNLEPGTLNFEPPLIAPSSRRQQKQDPECPDTEEESGDGPWDFSPPVVAGDDAAEDGVENVNHRRRAQQRRRFHFRPDQKKSGEITHDLIKIHCGS